MTFADELRSSKGPQVPQLTKEQKAARLNTADTTITMLKEKARSMNNHGEHSISGWLAHETDYDVIGMKLINIQKKFVYDNHCSGSWNTLDKASFQLESLCGNYPGCIDDLRREIEKRLKQLGFRASVKKVEVPLYSSYHSDFWGRPKKVGISTTLEIEFSW